jgi:major membrane immunogen (membrane-anchored lipoprotein)
MKRLMLIFAVLSIAVLLVACGSKTSDQEKDKGNDNQSTGEVNNQEIEFNHDEKVNEDTVVANINDIEVTGEIYNLIYVQTKIQLNQFGEDISDLDKVKEIAIDGLINQEIIKQDAKKAGIVVSEDELTSEFEAIKSENEEQFQTYLEKYQLTEEAFRNQLSFAIMHDKYVESELPTIEISDEEIETVYNELKDNGEIAKLKDVAEQLKQELTIQKEQENLQERLEELKKDATIEKLI